MKKNIYKIQAALLLGAMLAFPAGALPVHAEEQAPVADPAAAPAVDPAAVPTPDPAAAPAVDPAAVPAPDPAAAPAADPAAVPAPDPAAAPAADPAAVPTPDPAAAPAADPAAVPAPDPAAAPAADPNVPTDPATGSQAPSTGSKKAASSSKKSSGLSEEQVKRAIEASLDSDAKDAILNGYLSLLSKNYILKDELDLELTSIGNSNQLESRAAEHIAQMISDARKEGLRINIISSYRTYMKQVTLFKNKIERLEAEGKTYSEAVEEAGTVVAVPGTSEHQLGLTVDFMTGSYRKLDEGIRNTKEYKWVEEHSWEYGYVIRYPKDKSSITGIISEPWHLRYVGIPAAKLIMEQGVCLEEFLGVAYDGQKNGISHGAGWANTGR